MPTDLLATAKNISNSSDTGSPKDLLASPSDENYLANQLSWRPGEDIVSGVGKDIQGVSQLIAPKFQKSYPKISSYLNKISQEDLPSRLGLDSSKTGLLDKYTQDIGSYMPFSLIPGSSYPATIAANALAGTVLNPSYPKTGAIVGGATGAITKGVTDIIGSQAVRNFAGTMTDFVRNMLKKRAAEKLAQPYVNKLITDTGNSGNMSNFVGNNVRTAFNTEKEIADQNYEPLNNSKLMLNEISKDQNNPFPNYTSKAQQLLVQRENLENTFGKVAPDMSTSLTGELNKAQTLLGAPPELPSFTEYGVSLPEAIQRIQTLGKLGSSIQKSQPNQARLLFDLQDGLKSDGDNLLRNSGNGDLADQLQTATQHYKNNVIPFFRTPELRKTITTKIGDTPYIPNAYKLAREIHDPNSNIILGKLDNATQNGLLSKLLTGGQEATSGLTTQNADQIASKWNSLSQDEKKQVSTYNPRASQFFDSLRGYINQPKGIKEAAAALTEDHIINAFQGAYPIRPPGISRDEMKMLLSRGQRALPPGKLKQFIPKALNAAILNDPDIVNFFHMLF